MSGDILTTYFPGSTLYYVIVDSQNSIWDGSTFVTFNSANWIGYAITLPEISPPGVYFTNFPSEINIAGTYSLIVYSQSGGNPAVSDQTVRAGTIIWDGEKEVSSGGLGSNVEESFEVGEFPPFVVSSIAGVSNPAPSSIKITTGVR